MSRQRTRHLAWIGALALGLAAPAASGGTRTGTLTVQATVSSACALATTAMDFGTYYAGGVVRDAAGSIGYVKCYNTALTIELDAGQNGSGGNRNMKSGTSLLRYEIYQDSARTKVLGTGTGALPVASDAAGEAAVPIYGRIFSGQVVPAGTYTDAVGIVLTF